MQRRKNRFCAHFRLKRCHLLSHGNHKCDTTWLYDIKRNFYFLQQRTRNEKFFRCTTSSSSWWWWRWEQINSLSHFMRRVGSISDHFDDKDRHLLLLCSTSTTYVVSNQYYNGKKCTKSIELMAKLHRLASMSMKCSCLTL